MPRLRVRLRAGKERERKEWKEREREEWKERERGRKGEGKG